MKKVIIFLIIILIIIICSLFFLKFQPKTGKAVADNDEFFNTEDNEKNDETETTETTEDFKETSMSESEDTIGSGTGNGAELPPDLYTKECGFYFNEYNVCAGTCLSGACMSEGRSCYCKI